MDIFEDFNIDKKEMGVYRKSFLKKIQKAFGKYLTYNSVYAPIPLQEEKRSDISRLIRGHSKTEQQVLQTLLFCASVSNHSFNNIIVSVLPNPFGTRTSEKVTNYLPEFSYTAVLPYATDAIVIHIKKAGFRGKNGFFVYPTNLDLDIISTDNLFNSNDNCSAAFKLAENLQQTRFRLSISGDISEIMDKGETSKVSEFLNQDRNILKKFKKLASLTNLNSQDMRIDEDFGITIILIPNGGSTIVQIGDFAINPKLGMETLELLTDRLSRF